MQLKRILSVASTGALLCGSMVALTSCGSSGDNHNAAQAFQLQEVSIALSQAQSKLAADQAALLAAQSAGVDPVTLAGLQQLVLADGGQVQNLQNEAIILEGGNPNQ